MTLILNVRYFKMLPLLKIEVCVVFNTTKQKAVYTSNVFVPHVGEVNLSTVGKSCSLWLSD